MNTQDEKGAARCPRHRQEWERTRKAAQRASKRDQEYRPVENPDLTVALHNLEAAAAEAKRATRVWTSHVQKRGADLDATEVLNDVEAVANATSRVLRHVDEILAYMRNKDSAEQPTK